MQLREFAESILFADTVEAKLRRPASTVVDEERGPAIAAIDEPGRPTDLRFNRDDTPATLPGAHELEDENQRGVLLHFFCNHELLATELMAYVLLRFPDAPAAFRWGVYETLREEQKHTLWYLRRMEECGVKFGRYPVSSFFWRSVAPMETPLDYVSRLSLTFEQANLDYSRYYAEVFQRSGDQKSASILRHIYKDEIGHVRYGLDWFRRWKRPETSDWDAFGRQLPFPLSPSRAKANGAAEFNAEGRLEAGLDADFVRQLRNFERSKGRTPRVFWFCPDAENDIADAGYQPRAEVEILARDLDILPAFLAAREDIVLVHRRPSLEHCERLRAAGFELPEFEELSSDGQIQSESLTRERKLGGLRPWAWCPAADRLFADLRAESGWNSALRDLFSKVSDQQLLDGVVVNSVDELRRQAAQREVVVKAPFGASGQRNQRWSGEPTARWAERVIAKQGAVVVEPWFDRVFDFSVQYEMEKTGLRKVGITKVENNPRGQFVAAEAGPKLLQGLPEELARFLAGEISRYDGEIREAVERYVEPSGYLGPIGVDAMVHRGSGRLQLRPIVEINPRYTMGRLTLELRKKLASKRTACCVRFELLDKSRLVSTDSLIVLNDPGLAERTLAVLSVAPNFRQLRVDREARPT